MIYSFDLIVFSFADVWNSFVNFGLIFVLSYFIYLLPHFFFEKTLFLHHYFPSLLFKLMLTACLIEHLNIYIKHRLITLSIVSIILLASFYCFYKFLLFTYGTGAPTGQQINDLKWVKTWNFIVHK
jgi:PREDICTED: similar to AGAP010784-PA